MSNTITIQYTKFANIDENGNEGSFDYGYRMYDNYASIYNNCFDNLSALKEEVNEENFWERLEYHSEEFEDADLSSNGIEFNGTFYDWDEINGLKEEIERRTAKRCED